MSLVALDGTPLVKIGSVWNAATVGAWTVGNILQDAANEACIMFGHIMTDDGASHTIDTSGSSSLQWRTGGVTFANAGSTFKVGLATMNTTTGPFARPTNVSNVITFSVSRSMTGGGGGVTADAWQTHVPDAGTMSVANGDLIAFCTQLTARGGTDLINTSLTVGNSAVVVGRPSATAYVGTIYGSAGGGSPNCIISFSDGHLGWFGGSAVFSTATAQTWNSGSGTVEYGNYLQFPFPVKVYGIYSMFALGGDCDFVLYSNPLGTPVAEKTVSADANVTTVATVREYQFLFDSPYTTTANQPLAVIAKPAATNVTMTYWSQNAAAHQVTDHCGTNGYAVNRASGAFAAQNSSKDRFPIGLLVGAFEAGGGGGGGSVFGSRGGVVT